MSYAGLLISMTEPEGYVICLEKRDCNNVYRGRMFAMEDRTTRNVSVLILAACLLLSANAFGDQLRMVNNLRNEGVLVPYSAPNRDDLTFLNYMFLTEAARTVGSVAYYDDPKTERPVDYLEVSDGVGNLLFIGWLDRFGIARTAVDRGLLEGDGTKLRGILLLVPEGMLS